MKKIIIILLLTISLALVAEAHSQDEMNKMYMSRLDLKLTQVTKVLGAYNDSQKNMKDVKNLQYLNDFLYKMTLEVGKVRKLIIESETMKPAQRSDATSVVISSLKSDVFYDFSEYIDNEKDMKNKAYLIKVSEVLHKRLDASRKALIATELTIAETREITFKYMDIHSQQFLYSYILSFIDISSYLDVKDRDYLATIVENLIEEMEK
ncbi:MAG: hypothetical protein KAS49_07585 [Candidatus Cloacimonetes bacterium]|nr:hypothetical protein [Candidatus Cloacimonadota bacterium]